MKLQQDVVADENELIKFMKIKPIWELASLDRDSYLKLITDEKSTLINWYYLFMKSNSGVGVKFY